MGVPVRGSKLLSVSLGDNLNMPPKVEVAVRKGSATLDGVMSLWMDVRTLVCLFIAPPRCCSTFFREILVSRYH